MPVEVTHNPWVWAFIATPILHIWLSRISKRYLIKGLAPALALLFARFAFGQRTTLREAIGMVLVVGGVALLLWAY